MDVVYYDNDFRAVAICKAVLLCDSGLFV